MNRSTPTTPTKWDVNSQLGKRKWLTEVFTPFSVIMPQENQHSPPHLNEGLFRVLTFFKKLLRVKEYVRSWRELGRFSLWGVGYDPGGKSHWYIECPETSQCLPHCVWGCSMHFRQNAICPRISHRNRTPLTKKGVEYIEIRWSQNRRAIKQHTTTSKAVGCRNKSQVDVSHFTRNIWVAKPRSWRGHLYLQ